MANRTVKDANSVKGTNPQYLIEKIIRTRIYESRYWKEECFALSAELMVDKAMELKYIGGVFGGNIKPTPFLCLVLKMLQIQPEKDIVVEFIRNEDFKYVRALGAFYMRLIGTSMDCYKYLEPLYNDFRKIKKQNRQGEFTLVHMDEFIDELLREDRVCDVILPRIQKRQTLEDTNQLETRISALDEDMEIESEEEDDYKEIRRSVSPPEKRSGYKDWDKVRRSPSPKFRRSRSPAHKDKRHRDREHRDRDRHRDNEHNRHRDHRDRDHKDRGRDRERHRSRSRERKHRSKSPSHRHRKDDESRHHRHHKSKKSKRDRHDKDEKSEDQEIREANELRAKLGMAPLKP